MQTGFRGQFSGAFIHQLERLFEQGTAIGLTEGELLERFVRGHDEAAFEALIARHGPMVMGICRRMLRDPHDVDDAFQATFLVLVRKAGTLRRRDLLGNWLYGVAHRVATRSRVLAARRLARTPFGPDAVDQLAGRDEEDRPMSDRDPAPWLHDEVRRLPEKYRTLVLLCYFEGLSYDQAATRLNCPIGTVKGRLSRARELLRKRLVRRGVDLSGAALAALLALPDPLAAIPASLKSATLEAARSAAASTGGSLLTASSVSLSVASLTDGVLRTMTTTHLKAVSFVFLVAGAVTTGLVIAATQGPDRPDEPDSQPPAAGSASREGTGVIAREKKAGANSAPSRQPAGGSSRPPAKADGADGAPQGGGGGGIMMGRPRAGGGQPGEGFGAAGGKGLDNQSFGGGGDDSAEVERQVRLDIVELSAALAVWDKTPQNDAVFQELDKPLTMSFGKPTPLDEVLKYIKTSLAKRTGGRAIPVYVDPKGLEDAEVKSDSRVTIDLEGAPLKTSLRLILKQLGLAYCVRDGVLIISSVEGIHEELAEEARELMGNGEKKDQIDMRVLARTGVIQRGMFMGGGMGAVGGGMGAVGGGMGAMGGGMGAGAMGGGMRSGGGAGMR